MLFRAGPFRYTFPRPALVMGVLNVTPDSFSDGGKFLEPARAADRALAMIEEGADFIDVGGESTRPHATPVDTAEELRRVLPVFKALAGKIPVPLSIDTRKADVARAAVDAGAALVNNVGAAADDPPLWELVARSGCGYGVMHMQGTPETMQLQPRYANVVGEIDAFFGDRLKRLENAGVSPDQVVLDVGIGFGKSVDHNLQLLANLDRFTRWNRPMLIGVSRKSFLGKVAGAGIADRLAPGLACACWAVQKGAQIIRTHDVRETVHAVRMLEGILKCRS